MADHKSSSEHSPSDDEKMIEEKTHVVTTSDGTVLVDPDVGLSEEEKIAAVRMSRQDCQSNY